LGTVKPYGSSSREMLAELRDGQHLKVEAFVAWMDAGGNPIDRSLVSHWCAGRSHLPADVLPLLANFTGQPEAVFGPYLRPAHCTVAHVPDGTESDEDLVDLILEAGSTLGKLQHALHEARMPESPGGHAITTDERDGLRHHLDELIQRLADIRVRLVDE